MEKDNLFEPLFGPQSNGNAKNNSKADDSIQANQKSNYSLNFDDERSGDIEELDNEEEDKEYEEYMRNAPSRMEKQSIIGEEIKWRKIHFNDSNDLNSPDRVFKSNEIHTAKYTWYTFLPKNLFYQFIKIANLYFLIMMCFQMIPQISNSQGRPTILMPLGFVVLVSMIKDIIEDSKRHASDNKENSSKVLSIPRPDQMRHVHPDEEGVFKTLKWSQLKVGQIVKVVKDQYFPADLILLNSDDPQGICFVETKNLDGETNMKSKIAHKFTVP